MQLRCSISVGKQIEMRSILPFAAGTTANLALSCVTEFSWQQRKMPTLRCIAVQFLRCGIFMLCLITFVRACIALPVAGNRALHLDYIVVALNRKLQV